MASTKTAPKIPFSAQLLRPTEGGDWTFLVLPKAASAKLPSRGQTLVDGTLNGAPFRSIMVDPDGQKSHWFKVELKLQKAAGVTAGDEVTLEIMASEAETSVPPDLKKALATAPKARAAWEDITINARRDWIHWVTCAKQAETRAKRVNGACDMLAKGKRRVCCFDRSGFYSKQFSAPMAAKG